VRRPLVILVLLACVAPAGCGNDREQVASGPAAPSDRAKPVEVPRAGLSLQLPSNMDVSRTVSPPAVFRATLGEPFVSCYAYRRREQLPRNARELDAARRRLVRTVEDRDAGYRLRSSRSTKIRGSRAIVLLGRQTIAQRRLTIRSLHVFKGQAEYVIEVAAPVAQFARFDKAVTPLVERSLDVTGKVRPT
jgi:hypothetical protein